MEAGSKRVFKEVAEDGTGKVINLAEQKLMKNAANGSGKAVSKVVGEGVESAAGKKGMITTIISKAKEGVEFLAKLAVEKFPKLKGLGAKLLKLVDPVLTLIAKNSDNVLLKFGKKIATTLGKATAGAATGFVLDAVLAVGDLATGLTAGNAGNLFGVSTENVDARMRIISSIFQAFFNFSYISIVSLVNEITNAMFNFNFIRQLAIGLYNLTGGKADFSSRITSEQIDSCSSIEEALQLMGITSDYETDMLKDGDGNWKDFSSCKNEEFVGVITEAEQMELARLQYNLANGTKISAQGWVDKESETFGSKALKWTKKLFTKDTAQQKYNKLTNKAEKRATKAEEYRKKASESTNIFSKGWNSGMAWVNDKLSKRATKKAEKTKIKAATKKAKAEEKLDYHTQKAANATGISKWYHNWRANANQKKVERYTMDGDKVVPQQNLAEGGTPSTEMSYAQQHIIPKEVILREYDLAEGDTLTDVYGNMYDHTGACIFSPDDHAGMGDGEPEEQIITPVQQEEPKKKKSGLLSKSIKTLLKATPGTAALATLFGKNKKADDYRMVPIMDENGNIVSYQSKLIKDTTEIEGYDKTNVKVDKMGKNVEVIPQTDEKGNVISYTTVEKNKSKGLLGKIASGIGTIFGLGSSSNSSSVDNSVTTTTSGDTYNTTNNEVDTTMFGPLTDAINNLVGSQGSDNVDEEGNVKTGGILAAILDPMGYLTKKLTNVGVNLYEEKTGKEVDKEKLNKGLEIFNMLRNPLGYLYSKTKEYVNNEENKGKSWKEIGKNAIEDGKENLNKAWDWTTDKVDNAKKWGKEKIDAVNEWGKKQYNKSDDVADIIMGDNKAKANILTTGISTSSDMITAIWNKFAPKEAQFAEGEVADFIATMLNRMIIKPFQKLMDPLEEKWNEAKEAVSGWVGSVKDGVTGWFNENIKKPWNKSTKEAKEILKETGAWIGDVKDSFIGWYKENIKKKT